MKRYKSKAVWFNLKAFIFFLFLLILVFSLTLYSRNGKTGKVERIDLVRKGNTVILKRIDSKWFVNIYDKWKKCDNEKVNSLIKKVDNIRIYGLVGSGSDVLGSFGVTGSQGVEINVYKSDSKWSGVFGKRVKGVNRIFLRLKNSKEIYEAEYPGSWIYAGVNFFTSMKVVENRLDPDEIDKITFYRGHSQYQMFKQQSQSETSWVIYSGINKVYPDTKMVDNLIMEILNVQGRKIFTESVLDTLSSIAEIKMEKNDKTILDIYCFKGNNENYYLKEKNSDFLFLISKDIINRILPEIEDFVLYY